MAADYREEPCKAALHHARIARMGKLWTLNPYTGCVHRCTFCYVRGFERRAERPSDERYGASIRVKTNIAAVLRRELRRSSWNRETVTIGTATDPYQPAEGRYRLTRACIEELLRATTPIGIITRGPLVVRDVDVLAGASSRVDVRVNISIGTLDERIWRTTEPATAPPRQRLRAVRTLVEAGIQCGVSVAPILPGLSDSPEQLEAVVRAARDAGATHMWGNTLNLRPGTREHFLECLARDWPEQLARYTELYERPYLPDDVSAAMKDQLHELRDRYGIADRRPRPIVPPPPPAQLAFLL
mgnify:CR=1 FL=1